MARYFRDPIGYMSHLYQTHGNVARLVAGGNDPLFFHPGPRRLSTIFAFGPECNREVLTQPDVFESGVLRGPGSCAWLVHNMSSANREHRAEQRRMMAPAFARNHLQVYRDDIIRYTQQMLDRWRVGARIDLPSELEHMAANVASKTFYGQDPDSGKQTLAALARAIASALFSPLTMVPLDLPGSPYRKFLRTAEQAGEAVLEEIRARRATGAQGDDVLSMMIRVQDTEAIELSDAELIGNAFTLFLAGHDVPANAMTFTLYLLSQHPAVMADLLDELDHELGGRPPLFEEVWKLPVLDRVVRESLRLLSPAILLWRQLTSDAELLGHELPAGSEVLLSPYITHTSPAVYTEPKRYQPRRWEEIKPTPFEYLPFSYGFRKCLGAALAEMWLKIVVSMVVQRFRLQIIPEARIDLAVTFTMRPKPGLPMVIQPQDRQFQQSRARVRGRLAELVEIDF